jgi:hypothetical protein
MRIVTRALEDSLRRMSELSGFHVARGSRAGMIDPENKVLFPVAEITLTHQKRGCCKPAKLQVKSLKIRLIRKMIVLIRIFCKRGHWFQ